MYADREEVAAEVAEKYSLKQVSKVFPENFRNVDEEDILIKRQPRTKRFV